MTIDCSIIIPTCNHPELARRAIESVRRQCLVSMEIIVCDDSATDNIALMVDQWHDARIVYRRHRPPLGAPQNWNAGLRLATGRYVMVLHHDESLTDDHHLWQMMQQMQLSKSGVAVAQVAVISRGQRLHRFMPDGWKRWMLRHPSTLLAHNAIGPCGCLLIARNHMVPFRPELHWLVDVEWYYQLLRNSRCCYMPHLVVTSRHGHEGQISQTIDVASSFRSDAAVLHQCYPERRAVWWMLRWGALTVAVKQLLHRI